MDLRSPEVKTSLSSRLKKEFFHSLVVASQGGAPTGGHLPLPDPSDPHARAQRWPPDADKRSVRGAA